VLNAHTRGSPIIEHQSQFFLRECCFIIKDPVCSLSYLNQGKCGRLFTTSGRGLLKTNPFRSSTFHGRNNDDTDDPQRTDTDEYGKENSQILTEPRDFILTPDCR
jgi:hypothetical protein